MNHLSHDLVHFPFVVVDRHFDVSLEPVWDVPDIVAITFQFDAGCGRQLPERVGQLELSTDSRFRLLKKFEYLGLQDVSPSDGEIHRFVADISKAEKILGYDPSHSMADGVDEAISWYETNDQLFDRILGTDDA